MENMVSLKQSHELMAKLGTNCDWSVVSTSAAQQGIEHPQLQAEITRFVQNGCRMVIVTTDGIVLPPGARMHVVTVMVDESRPWDETVNAMGPNTPADWDIRKVGDQYPPTVGATPKMKVVYLINFGKNTMGDDNIAWGKSQKLHSETPRTVSKIAEENPNLDETLGMKGCMGVVSLKESSFEGDRRAPSAWWDGTARGALLGGFDDVWRGDLWFAFSRESELETSDPVALRQQAEAK